SVMRGALRKDLGDNPRAHLSVHSRESGNPEPSAGSPQRGPRDAGVGGAPRGHERIVGRGAAYLAECYCAAALLPFAAAAGAGRAEAAGARAGAYLATTERSSCAMALSGKRFQTSSMPSSGMPR